MSRDNRDCQIYDEWVEHREDFGVVRDRIETMHNNNEVLKETLLSVKDDLHIISSSITDMRDHFIKAALSKDTKVVSTLIILVLGLFFVIGTLLIGEHFGVIRELFR